MTPVAGGARAAYYVGNRGLTVTDAEPRSLGEREVAVDVAYTGICGTDLHILHGAMDGRVTCPAVLGHEMAGTVSAVGDRVADWTVGDHVTVLPLGSCGECPACRAGHRHVCHRLNFLGIDSPGSMQTTWIVPADALIALPAALPLQRAALAEPTAVAVHDVSRGRVREGEHVVVVGGGPIGVLVACAARARGAEVVLVELSEPRLALASRLGFAAIDPTAVDTQAYVTDWSDGAGADVAFEVSGAAAGIETAIQSLSVRGRLVIVAIHATPPPVNLFQVFWRELTVIGARVYKRVDFIEAVRLLGEEAIPADELVTRVDALEDVAGAFAELESGRAMKVLIDCQAGR